MGASSANFNRFRNPKLGQNLTSNCKNCDSELDCFFDLFGDAKVAPTGVLGPKKRRWMIEVSIGWLPGSSSGARCSIQRDGIKHPWVAQRAVEVTARVHSPHWSVLTCMLFL